MSSPFKNNSRVCWLVLILVLTFILSIMMTACKNGGAESTSAPPNIEQKTTEIPQATQPHESTQSPLTLQEIADQIAIDVGVVLDVSEGDPAKAVFVFEERHDSILGQIEIAIMFNRLYRDHNTRHIGLEGFAAEEGVLDLTWGHFSALYIPGMPITVREDVFVHMAQDGILNSAELTGLVYSDVIVHGIDDAKLYAVSREEIDFNLPFYYLYNITIQTMSDTEYTAFSELYTQEQYTEAFDFAIGTSDYATGVFERLVSISDMASPEERYAIFEELQVKAAEVYAGITPDEEADLEAHKEYLLVVSQRSDVMVANLKTMLATNPGAITPISIGAAHTDRVVELLTEESIPFAVIQPKSLAEESAAGLYTEEAYTRLEQGISPSPNGSLGALLEGRIKPRPQSSREETILEAIIRISLGIAAENFDQTGEWGDSGDLPLDIESITMPNQSNENSFSMRIGPQDDSRLTSDTVYDISGSITRIVDDEINAGMSYDDALGRVIDDFNSQSTQTNEVPERRDTISTQTTSSGVVVSDLAVENLD
jgi:hypothetical protein